MVTRVAKPTFRGVTTTDVKALRVDVPTGIFSWPEYVTPRPLAAEVVDRLVKPAMIADMHIAVAFDDPEMGWKRHLCDLAAPIVCGTPEAMARRLFAVLKGKGHIAYIEAIEGWLIAAGYHLDLDTTLPVMPGNRYLALDLLQIRAEQLDPKVKARDVMHLVPELIELCWEIVTNPDRAEDLMNDAPFNCLRPMDR